jgi:hypothetical protein
VLDSPPPDDALVGDRQRCLDAGCDDDAAKSIERAALLATCAAWLRQPAPASVAAE